MSEGRLAFGRPQHRCVKTGDAEYIAFYKYLPEPRVTADLLGMNDLQQKNNMFGYISIFKCSQIIQVDRYTIYNIVYMHTKCSMEPRDDSLETFLHALADRPQYIKSSHSMGTADPTAGSHCGPSNFITITTCGHGSGYVVIRFGSNDKLASGHRTSSSTVCPSCYIYKLL